MRQRVLRWQRYIEPGGDGLPGFLAKLACGHVLSGWPPLPKTVNCPNCLSQEEPTEKQEG